MSKVLITGITGFIGSNLAKRLTKNGYDVYGLVRHTTSRSLQPLNSILDKVTLVAANINEYTRTLNALRTIRPNYILHLAALTPVARSFENPFEYEQTIVGGTMNVAHALMELPDHKKRKLIAASSAEVYGIQKRHKPFTEDTPLHPSSPYSVFKASADMYLKMAARVYDLNCVVLRPANTYGRKHDTNFIVEYLISSMIKRKRVYVGAPDSMRDYIHVGDHIRAYLLAMETDVPPGEAFNIGSGMGIRNRDLANKIAQIVGYEPSNIKFGAYPPGYPMRPLTSDQPYLALNSSKALKILGWQPSVTLENGLEETVDFWRKHLH